MTVLRRTLVALGAVVLVLAADLTLGLAWGALWGTPDAVHATRLPSGERVNVFRDVRASTPAMDGAPWAEELFAAEAHLRYDYLPFLYPRVGDTDTPLVHEEDGVRRSYEPDEVTARLPEVWFFGGSTTWGVAQRDEHTIPSEVARLAEAAGTPVRVVNFGQQGWSSWQEMQAFEMALAHRPAPAMAVFYDGANEFSVQLQEGRSVDPIPFQADRTAAAVDLAAMVSEGAVAPETPSTGPAGAGRRARWAVGSLVDQYAAQSLSGRLVDGLQGLFGADPADAQEATDGEPVTEDASEDVVAIYRRAQTLVHLLADRHDVAVASFWQPINAVPPGYADAVDALPDDVVDLTGVFDDEPSASIYVDYVHTNERGAQLVAAAIWAEIGPQL